MNNFNEQQLREQKIEEMARTLWRNREYGSEIEAENALKDFITALIPEEKCTCGEPHISKRIQHCYDGKPCHVKDFTPPESTEKEIVICAGIKLKDGRVLRCHRHGDGMLNAHHNGWELAEGMEQQGFVTSKGTYVSREEGRKLQDAAGIKSADKEGYRATTLFSEDLY